MVAVALAVEGYLTEAIAPAEECNHFHLVTQQKRAKEITLSISLSFLHLVFYWYFPLANNQNPQGKRRQLK